MKMKYILTSIMTMFILLVGCTTDEFNRLKEIKVSQSYIGLPLEGGSKDITITTTAEWTVEKVVVYDKKDPEKVIDDLKWVEISPMSGAAGSDINVNFKAGEASSDRVGHVNIIVNGKVQQLIVKQASESNEMVVSTVKEVLEGAEGKNYFVRGKITNISNTEYGNWDLVDEAGDKIYVYGTLDKNGAAQNFLSLGLAEGDEVLVSGPKASYNGTPQLKNVTVLEIKKSLLAAEATFYETEDRMATDVEVNVTCIDGGLGVVPPTEDWISVKSILAKGGDKYVVTLSLLENDTYAPRTAKFTLKHTDEKVTPVEVAIKQGGIEPPMSTIAEATAAEKGTFVTIKGLIVAIGYSSYVIADETGCMHIYKGAYTSKARLGDKVKVVGAMGFFNQAVQIQTPALEEKNKYGEVKHGTPLVIDGAAADALLGVEKIKIQYVTLIGNLSVSGGKYYNLNIDGATKAVGSFYSLTDKQKETLNPLKDKNVKLTGYLVSISSSKGNPKYINVIMDKVEEVK